jgi:uncharacterized membrane protein YphA (DoxX/SURF4 family)
MEDFGDDGALIGWMFNTTCGAKVAPDENLPFQGKRAAKIDVSKPEADEQMFSNLMQSVAAAPWLGNTVRYRAAVRTADLAEGTKVQLWCRIDGPPNANGMAQSLAFDNMDNRPIRSDQWQTFDIVLKVDDQARRIYLGIFVIGKGVAWLDDARLEVVDDQTMATDMNAGGEASTGQYRIPAIVRKAWGEAENAPQQPFFTPWLLLPAAAFILFAAAMFSTGSAAPQEVGRERDTGLFRKFAIRFAMAYWLLYCWPVLLQLIPLLGSTLNSSNEKIIERTVSLSAQHLFGITEPLVPPNGSGDTTYNYIAVLNNFILAILIATVWSLVDRRRTDYSTTKDLLRSYLRYSLALMLLGYGLAKTTLDNYNQFPINNQWQLDKTWGESSPMNVVWAFMGASRPYTIFAGLGEVCAAVLLIWRRTATFGALVAMGVMSNVAMLNFCYDIPVKLFSTHLLVMAILIAFADADRLLNVFFLHRPIDATDLMGVWRGAGLRWTRLVVKSLIILIGFAFPITIQARNTTKHLSNPHAETNKTEETIKSKYLLTRRGYRWINEVPFNR